LTQAAIRGMLNALGDPYTTYLSPAEINSLDESLKGGDFGGIGVYMVLDPRTKYVLVEPIEGTPAFRAGIKPGDEIVAVESHGSRECRSTTSSALIRGRVGTSRAPPGSLAHQGVARRWPTGRRTPSFDPRADLRARRSRQDGGRLRIRAPGRFRQDLV
jgi:hypothetical protein